MNNLFANSQNMMSKLIKPIIDKLDDDINESTKEFLTENDLKFII